jgi:glycosyltransferase involved in cell wall biosynthesis
MPKVSIIIPHKEDRGFLEEAIASAEAQRFDDYEIIIQQGDCSLGKNVNEGIKRSTGDYIKVLSSDDLLLPDSIEILYSKIIEGYDWVCGDAENFGLLRNGWENAQYWKAIEPTLAGMLESNQIHGGTTLYRTSILYETGGYDETLWTGEEYDLHLNLLASGYKVGIVNKMVYRYRLHEHNKSMDMSPRAKLNRKKYINEVIKARYYGYV